MYQINDCLTQTKGATMKEQDEEEMGFDAQEKTTGFQSSGVLSYVQSLIDEKEKNRLKEEEKVEEKEIEEKPNYLAQIEELLNEKYENKEFVKKIMSGEYKPKQQVQKEEITPDGRVVRKRNRDGSPNQSLCDLLTPQLRRLRDKLFINSSDAFAHVEEFLNNGGDPNTDFMRGMTLLHLTKNKEIAELLIERGANVNATDYLKRTPLHFATKSKLIEIVKLLIEKGANVDARTTKNWTPLFDASRWDAYEIMDYLVQKGADVRAVDIDGNSPLHIAVSFYKNETTKQVLKQGVPINTQNKKGQTALHIASKPRVAPKEQPLVIATLLSAGADKTIKDADNKTAYDIVKKSSRFSKTLL